jgi:hypothetical protein
MNRLIIACLSGLILLAALALFMWKRSPSGAETTRKLNEQFLTCLPEHLLDAQRREIAGILNRFFEMAAAGKVDPADQQSIRQELENYIRVGSISTPDLDYFMARVSYLTYKSNPNANLPDGEVDHPVLNPKSD